MEALIVQDPNGNVRVRGVIATQGDEYEIEKLINTAFKSRCKIDLTIFSGAEVKPEVLSVKTPRVKVLPEHVSQLIFAGVSLEDGDESS